MSGGNRSASSRGNRQAGGGSQPALLRESRNFAGPGTLDRHETYLRLVEPFTIPNICVVGNPDLDDPAGAAVWWQVHGPMNFEFGHGHTRFVAIHASSRPGRHDRQDRPEAVEGPREEDLEFLASALRRAKEPNR